MIISPVPVRRLSFLLCTLILLASLSMAQAPDRSAPPKLGAPPSLDLPAIQHLRLANGIPVLLMEKHQVPLIQMELVIQGGSVMDPSGKSGLARLTADMMDEGAGGRSSLQLADEIDYLGASISTYAGYHTSGVALHTPVAKLDSALSLFADIALRPAFPADELERKRKELLTMLLQWHDEPRAIASVAFAKTLFGTAHPYGRQSIGDEAGIRSFTRDDLKGYHDTYFHPNNASLIVVGDITAEKLLPRLESAFGAWKKKDVPQAALDQPEQVKESRIYLVDKPGAAQSEIRIGRIGVQRKTDDYYAILVMNTILGGSFSSRLNQNLREKHGYSYGASSGFDFRPIPGPFSARAAVQTAVTDSSLIEFMKELTAITEAISEDELTRAKNYLALQYPGDFQSVAQVTGQLTNLVNYNLPEDYFDTFVQKILAVTMSDVERVARKYIDPHNVAIIVVGDRSQIESGIRKLNIAPLEILTIEDILGKKPVLDLGN